MTSTATPFVRKFYDDLTVRWSCRARELVLWVGVDSLLNSGEESGWTMRDFWTMRDGDFVTITNRWADLPRWFELHPSEVAGGAAFKVMQRLQAGYQPTEPMNAPTIWRVKAGDRLVWASLERRAEPLREIIAFKACALVSGDSSTSDVDWSIDLKPNENELSA